MGTVESRTDDALASVQTELSRAVAAGDLDQDRAPVLEALRAFHASDPVPFSIPAHKAGDRSTT